MLDPEARGSEPTALLGAITRLTASVDRLQQFLTERQRDWERLSERSAGLSGAVQALKERGDRMAGDVDELRREQAAIARAIAEVEGHIAEQGQRQQVMLSALRTVGDLADRMAALENRRPAPPAPAEAEGGGEQQRSPDRPSIDDRQAEAPSPPDDSAERPSAAAPPSETVQAAPPPLSDLYQRVDRLERKEEVLLRIIELVVERARLAVRREAGSGGEPG